LSRRFLVSGALGALLVAPPLRAEPPAEPDPSDPATDLEGLHEAPMPPPGYLPGHRERQGLGLSPHVPGQQSVLPAAIAPAFGAPLSPPEGSKLEFHGYLQAGGRAGFNSRRTSREGQGSMIWHGDPIVPRGNVFENTNVVPYKARPLEKPPCLCGRAWSA
jgi:hypothetical protein